MELEARLALYQPHLRNGFRFDDHDRSAEVLVSWASKSEWGSLRIGAGYARGF